MYYRLEYYDLEMVIEYSNPSSLHARARTHTFLA